MAVPNYTTDLQILTDAEGDDTLYEMSGYETGGSPDPLDPVYPIQGTYCYVANQKNKTGLQSIAFNYGTAVTFAAGECIFMWHVMLAGDAIESFLNGGYQLLAGDDDNNFKAWRVGGNDYARNPYGGWQNSVVDPTNTDNVETGTQTTWQYFGSGINMTKTIQKGDLHGLDITTYGRGTLAVSGGEAGNYATFGGMSAINDNSLNRWGLFQEQAGSYLWKGQMRLGRTQQPVDFRDSNVNITVDLTTRTYPEFNRIEIRNASSRVDWTGINIQAIPPSGYYAPGNFEAIHNADININTCSFTDMGTFIFQADSTIDDTTFRRCDQIQWGGAPFDGCTFETTRASAAIYTEDIADFTGCNFIGDNQSGIASNAIHMGAAGTFASIDNTFTGYATVSGSPSAAIYNESYGHLVINVQGGNAPYVIDKGSSTHEVNQTVTQTFTGMISGSEIRIYAAGTQTELAGRENSPPTFEYTFNYVAGTYVDVIIHHIEYVYIRLEDFLLPDANASQTIQQQLDRWYSNP